MSDGTCFLKGWLWDQLWFDARCSGLRPFFMWPSPFLLALAVVFVCSARAVPKFVYFVVVVWRALIGAVFNGALPVIL